jgi:hypothetical protein
MPLPRAPPGPRGRLQRAAALASPEAPRCGKRARRPCALLAESLRVGAMQLLLPCSRAIATRPRRGAAASARAAPRHLAAGAARAEAVAPRRGRVAMARGAASAARRGPSRRPAAGRAPPPPNNPPPPLVSSVYASLTGLCPCHPPPSRRRPRAFQPAGPHFPTPAARPAPRARAPGRRATARTLSLSAGGARGSRRPCAAPRTGAPTAGAPDFMPCWAGVALPPTARGSPLAPSPGARRAFAPRPGAAPPARGASSHIRAAPPARARAPRARRRPPLLPTHRIPLEQRRACPPTRHTHSLVLRADRPPPSSKA